MKNLRNLAKPILLAVALCIMLAGVAQAKTTTITIECYVDPDVTCATVTYEDDFIENQTRIKGVFKSLTIEATLN